MKRDKASTPLETLLTPDNLFFHSLAKAGGAMLWSQAQNIVTCPAHPPITQSVFLFSFLLSTLQLSFVPEVKTKEREQESL